MAGRRRLTWGFSAGRGRVEREKRWEGMRWDDPFLASHLPSSVALLLPAALLYVGDHLEDPRELCFLCLRREEAEGSDKGEGDLWADDIPLPHKLPLKAR